MEVAARRGSRDAIKALEGPPYPEALEYLHRWILQLHARSGFGMSGYAPMTWATLDAWSRLTGNVPDGEDLDALFVLDAVLCHPEPDKDTK